MPINNDLHAPTIVFILMSRCRPHEISLFIALTQLFASHMTPRSGRKIASCSDQGASLSKGDAWPKRLVFISVVPCLIIMFSTFFAQLLLRGYNVLLASQAAGLPFWLLWGPYYGKVIIMSLPIFLGWQQSTRTSTIWLLSRLVFNYNVQFQTGHHPTSDTSLTQSLEQISPFL